MRRQISTLDKPPLLWWRLVVIATSLVVLGLGFATAYYTVPAPTIAEQVIFWLLLVLVFLETREAEWYRQYDPWELRIFQYVLQGLKWVLFAVLVISAALGIIYLLREFAPNVDDGNALGLFLLGFMLLMLLMLLFLAWTDKEQR